MDLNIITTIVSGFLALGSFVFSLYTYRKALVHDRKQATLDAYNQLQSQALDYINYYKTCEIKEIASNRRSEEYKKISAYIARIEHFCVGVNQKIYDFKTVYELAHGYLDGAIKTRIQLILDRKVMNNEEYYANIKKVLEDMDKETHKRQK